MLLEKTRQNFSLAICYLPVDIQLLTLCSGDKSQMQGWGIAWRDGSSPVQSRGPGFSSLTFMTIHSHQLTPIPGGWTPSGFPGN